MAKGFILLIAMFFICIGCYPSQRNDAMIIVEQTEAWPDIKEVTDEMAERIRQNSGKKTAAVSQIRTAEPAVSMLFTGISDETQTRQILKLLQEYEANANFFLTFNELYGYPNLVREISEGGHSVGCAGNNGTANINEIMIEIYLCGQINEEVKPYYFPYNGIIKGNDEVSEAVSAYGGQTLVSANKFPLKTALDAISNNRDPVNEIETEYFQFDFTYGFHRGDIIYIPIKKFNMWSPVVQKILQSIKDAAYAVKALDKIQQYPELDPAEIEGYSAIQYNSEFRGAADWASDLERFNKGLEPGYSKDDPHTDDKVDIQGEKVVFLTFDDWASDIKCTELLNILGDLKVEASFFVRTNGAENNPNLARAIYEAGHDLLSHSHNHYGLTAYETIEELQGDAARSHQILSRILGRAPFLYYRAPELSTEIPGRVNALFAAGYTHVVDGDVRAYDYREDLQTYQVINRVLEGTSPGSIIVMHMNDNSKGRDVIKVIIPELRARGYTFAKLSDYWE